MGKMKRSEYTVIEKYMLSCMSDSSHDPQHVYRVLYTALRLARTADVDPDILIASCLLHDIGREAQFKYPEVCHAREGAKMAESFLLGIGWSAQRARRVSDCIRTHRFRSGDPPQSVEAKILFDSDKLEAAGALGIARTLVYQGQVGHPLYTANGSEICPGNKKTDPASFYREYNIKLKKIYSLFYTDEARRIAEARRGTAAVFFDKLTEEVSAAYDGKSRLNGCLEEQ